MTPIIKLDPEDYSRHYLHGKDRIWAETNCYVDILIELIHSLGYEPSAALAFTLSVDFEVDQWTFFKFPHQDLYEMYGLDIQELNPWVSLQKHVEEQVAAGRPVLVEMDSFYLPDTKGTAYKSIHTKTTIAVNEIDCDAGCMGYFHGQDYYLLDGEDFQNIFQADGLAHERMLPPYIEIMKLNRSPQSINLSELTKQSVESLKRHLQMLPKRNPFESFRERFEQDVKWLAEQPMQTFHGYSFATLRQYGACFELSSSFLDWLEQQGEKDLGEIAKGYRKISEIAKVFQFKLARTIAKKKPLDYAPMEEMTQLWQSASDKLIARYL